MGVFILIVLAGIGIHELFRRLPIHFSLAFFGVLPIILTILWIHIMDQENHDWMTWIKIYLALIALNLINVSRWKYKNNKFMFKAIYVFVIVNLVLPISRFYVIIDNKIIATMMTISTICLCLALPNFRFMEVQKDSSRDFCWDIPYFWIIAYTLWNWSVVYLLFPPLSGNQTAMLLAPLLVAIKNKKLYVQARAYSFSFYLIMCFTIPSVENMLLTPEWNHIAIQWIAASVVLIYSLVYLIYQKSQSNGRILPR